MKDLKLKLYYSDRLQRSAEAFRLVPKLRFVHLVPKRSLGMPILEALLRNRQIHRVTLESRSRASAVGCSQAELGSKLSMNRRQLLDAQC